MGLKETLKNLTVKDVGIAVQNSIIIFLIVIALGPVFGIGYTEIPGTDYYITINFLISLLLSAYLIYSIIIGFIDIITGGSEGSQIIMCAILMWLPTLLINGGSNGYIVLMWLLNKLVLFLKGLIYKILNF